MGQTIWNVEMADGTKLNVKKDGTVEIITIKKITIQDLSKEQLQAVSEALNKGAV